MKLLGTAQGKNFKEILADANEQSRAFFGHGPIPNVVIETVHCETSEVGQGGVLRDLSFYAQFTATWEGM